MIVESYSYDDLMLVPQYSTIKSRSEVDVSVKMGKFVFKHPVIPANMKSIMGLDMAYEVINSGGLAILHRFLPLQEQIDITDDIIDNFGPNNFAISIGVKNSDKEALKHFDQSGVKTVCIDIAHGDSEHCIDIIRWIKENYPQMFIIAGNVATGKGAERLWKAGADAVKCGVGSGSLCSTRINTGNGVPQLSVLMEVSQVRETLDLNRHLYIISDGGVKSSGDLVKSLCFADMTMIGNMFAGCPETPEKIITHNGIAYRNYAGSSTHKDTHIEGVKALVPVKESYNVVLTKMLEGLKSGMSYQNARALEQLRDNPVFTKITNAGLVESHPHDVVLKD